MSISEDGSYATCWSQCGQFTRKSFLLALTGQTDNDWIPTRPVVTKQPTPPEKSSKPKAKKAEGCTLAELAAAKGLDAARLAELGWQDGYYPGSRIPSVIIPYWDQNNQNPIPRFRVNLSGNPKYWWKKGATLTPYGLWALDHARRQGYVVIVEGETDWAALSSIGIPALGLPGNQTWKMLWTHYLSQIDRVYVWIEPGERNEHTGLTPGEAMINSISPSVLPGHLYAIEAPEGSKDPCELVQQYTDKALPMMQQLICNATVFVSQEQRKQEEAKAQWYEERKGKGPAPTNPAETDPRGSEPGGSESPKRKYITDDQGSPDYGHSYHNPWDFCRDCHEIHVKRTAWAAEQGKTDPLTGEVRAHREHMMKLLRRRGYVNAEFSPANYGEKLCITMENPHLFIPHDWSKTLLELTVGREDEEGNPISMYKQHSECGLPCKWSCIEDGTRFTGHISCRCHFCQWCFSEIGRKLARVQLANLDPESEQRYCSTWLVTEHELPENKLEWTQELSSLMTVWEKEVAKLGRRKANKGKVYFRALGVYYTGNRALIHWKVMIFEASEHEADPAIEHLCAALGATVDSQRRYVSGQTAVMQIIEDSVSHLVGIDPKIPEATQGEIFAAHYFATKGRHIFQGLGTLHKDLQALPKPDPLLCDVCGRTLLQSLDLDRINGKEGEPAPGLPDPQAWKDTA